MSKLIRENLWDFYRACLLTKSSYNRYTCEFWNICWHKIFIFWGYRVWHLILFSSCHPRKKANRTMMIDDLVLHLIIFSFLTYLFRLKLFSLYTVAVKDVKNTAKHIMCSFTCQGKRKKMIYHVIYATSLSCFSTSTNNELVTVSLKYCSHNIKQ